MYDTRMITFDDFKKVEIRAGKILSAEKIPDTDKLLKLSVDFGEQKEVVRENLSVDAVSEPVAAPAPAPVFVAAPRQIVSGISMYFPDPAVLVGKTCMFVTNLEPRTIKGHESNGMLFAVSTGDGSFSLLEPNASIPPGTKAA
jgi:tRNA-binding EMAP/Myf-like protein